MPLRSIALSLAAAFLAASAGCIVHTGDHPHGGPPGQTQKVVVVGSSHVCFDACDHYHIEGVWYVETGHRHGANCGHYLVKGKWGKDKGDDDDDDDDNGKDKKKKKNKKDDD